MLVLLEYIIQLIHSIKTEKTSQAISTKSSYNIPSEASQINEAQVTYGSNNNTSYLKDLKGIDTKQIEDNYRTYLINNIDYHNIEQRLSEWYKKNDTNFKELSIINLSEECNIDIDALFSYFKNHLNTSFRQWRLEKRICKAQELLLSQDYRKISDIASELGFNDSSHFYRQFKEYSQCSPKRWRDSNGKPYIKE